MLLIGHRGAAGHAPENTIPSIDKAVALGVDLVEFDVQRTADGKLILMHDKRVNRTTDAEGLISEMKWDDLRKLDAGKGQKIPIPTLEEVLRRTNGVVDLMLEIITPGIASEVCDEVDRIGFSGSIIYASFLHAELLVVQERAPSASTLALIEGVPVHPTQFARDANVSHVGLSQESLTEGIVKALQSEGFRVFVYTVNHPLDIARVEALRVDGIISDHPERVRRG